MHYDCRLSFPPDSPPPRRPPLTLSLSLSLYLSIYLSLSSLVTGNTPRGYGSLEDLLPRIYEFCRETRSGFHVFPSDGKRNDVFANGNSTVSARRERAKIKWTANRTRRKELAKLTNHCIIRGAYFFIRLQSAAINAHVTSFRVMQ
jgi:hypothetical protein